MPPTAFHPQPSAPLSASSPGAAEHRSSESSLMLLHEHPESSAKASVFGTAILQNYASHIDPLQTNGEIHTRQVEHNPNMISIPGSMPLQPSKPDLPPFPANSPPSTPTARSFFRYRNITSNIVPRQTIMKALASRPPGSSNPSAPVAAALTSMLNQGDSERDQFLPSSTSQRLAAAMSSIQIRSPPHSPPSNAPFPIRSPCFFHQRFEGIINFDRVLDEIADEGEFSHSRLMQTATGVREVSKQLQRRPIKRAVRNVMIVTKARDHKLVLFTRELAEWLITTPRYDRDVGVNVYVDAKLRKSTRFDAPSIFSQDARFEHMLKYWTPELCWTSPEKFDLVLTLGGDGTVLFTSWLFQRVVPPILSFSLGSLGFLTNFEFNKYKEQLNRVMGEAGMRVNLRMRFTCTVWRTDRSPSAEKGAVDEGEQFEVLNELVIDRGPSPYVSNLELYGDNELLTIVQADGCIFSTPTGSTAYSLSAGGSLIHPSIPAILLTPICPHTLSFRPMVLSDTLALRIAVPEKSRSTAYCSFDGKGRIELKQGDYVTLEASQYPFPTVMVGGNEWVESVQRALRWNVRGAVQKGWDSLDTGPGEGEAEEEMWDIDIDPYEGEVGAGDSGIAVSEDGASVVGTGSPARRGNGMLSI